jgi:nucleoside-diphosphate-sugar epimerase
LPIVLTRPFNYTGIGQSELFLLPKIVAHFKRRAERIELGNLDVARDFSDVRDVVRCYRLLADSPARGEAINVCSETCSSLAEILRLCERITGHSMPVSVNPAFVRGNEVRRQLGSAARLRQLIGPLPRRGIEDTLRWMLEAGA